MCICVCAYIYIITVLNAADQIITLTPIQNTMETALIPTLDVLPNVTDTPAAAQVHSSVSSRKQNSWISQFAIPWSKMPASLLQATIKKSESKTGGQKSMGKGCGLCDSGA